MAKSDNLRKAQKANDDEHYTRKEDICSELCYYKKHFKGKTVFCNCDDPEMSNFWIYFVENFHELQMKKLISTHYNRDGSPSYKLEYDGTKTTKTDLVGNGDFRSEECIEILKTADMVVTNPPFSLIREYFAQLMEYKKSFLIIFDKNHVSLKEIFPLFGDNLVWLGYTHPDKFLRPDGTMSDSMQGRPRWVTNLDILKRTESLIDKLHFSYEEHPENYPKYDNYDAIEVGKVKEIPYDYYEMMGVPITFLDNHNPTEFEIIGLDRYTVPKEHLVGGRVAINGKPKYARILIKRKEQPDENN